MTGQHSAVRMQLRGDALIFTALVNGGPALRTEGSVSSIRNAMGHGNLTGAQVENAIAQAEDLITPIIRGLPASERLEVGGAEFEEIVQLLADNNRAVVSIESVENLFNQLADHASGSPVAWRQPVPATQVALGIVVLREVMHHGGYRTVLLSQ